MFLEQTDISNSQFADSCKIPRPTLSQLLNGRNKKVSDEVIAKIHSAYPSLNIMWLMFGDGEMLMSAPVAEDASEPMSMNGADGGKREISFADDAAVGYQSTSRPVQRLATPSTVNEAIQSIMRSNTVARGSRGGTSPEARRVVNIMVFYSDGRFEEFGPLQ